MDSDTDVSDNEMRISFGDSPFERFVKENACNEADEWQSDVSLYST